MQPCWTFLFACLSWMMGSPLMGQPDSLPVAPQTACHWLQARGPLPQDFLTTYQEKYEHAVAGIQARFPRQQELQKAYYRESLYYTHQLIRSGHVLFHDTVSHYIQAVADQLLRNRADLRQAIRLYAVRSSAVNAFAAGNGIILVNVGLIAQLDNEAQLAYILSHEIAHYVKQHSLGIFLEAREASSSWRDLKGDQEVAEQLMQQNLYSQAAEFDADEWGTRLYLSSGYDLTAIAGAFRILKEAWRPFDERTFPIADYLPPGLHLRAAWLTPPPASSEAELEPVVMAGAPTHPNPVDRYKAVQAIIADVPNGGRKPFFLGEAMFTYIRDCCRFNTCMYYLLHGRYEYALIGAQDLLQRYPQQREILHIQAYAWYALARYAHAGRFFDVHQSYYHLRGGGRHLTWLTERLSTPELCIMAILACWRLHQRQPEAQLPLEMLKELGRDLVPTYLSLDPQQPDSLHLRPLLSVYPALVAQLKDWNASDSLPPVQDIFLPADRRQMSKDQRQMMLKGANLDLNQVVFVNPTYLQIDERLLVPIRFQASIRKEARFTQHIGQYAQQLSLSANILDVESLHAGDIQTFQELTLLQDWETFYQGLSGVMLRSPFHDDLLAFCQRQGTPYVAWISCYAFARYRVGKPLVLAAGVFFPPLLPYSLYYAFTPRYDTVLYLQVYDLAENRLRVIYPRIIQMRDRSDVVYGQLYDLLSQLE